MQTHVCLFSRDHTYPHTWLSIFSTLSQKKIYDIGCQTHWSINPLIHFWSSFIQWSSCCVIVYFINHTTFINLKKYNTYKVTIHVFSYSSLFCLLCLFTKLWFVLFYQISAYNFGIMHFFIVFLVDLFLFLYLFFPGCTYIIFLYFYFIFSNLLFCWISFFFISYNSIFTVSIINTLNMLIFVFIIFFLLISF